MIAMSGCRPADTWSTYLRVVRESGSNGVARESESSTCTRRRQQIAAQLGSQDGGNIGGVIARADNAAHVVGRLRSAPDGHTASLSEDGFQATASWRCPSQMRTFTDRLLDHLGAPGVSEDVLDEIALRHSGVVGASAARLSFARLVEEMLSHVPPSSGIAAPLTEVGYAAVAALRSNDEMRAFIRRVVTKLGGRVAGEASLSGFVPFFSGVSAVQSLAQMEAELRGAQWVLQRSASPRVGGGELSAPGSSGSSRSLSGVFPAPGSPLWDPPPPADLGVLGIFSRFSSCCSSSRQRT